MGPRSLWITLFRRIVARLLRRRRARDLERELDFHLASLERDLAAEGVPTDEARQTARRQLGNRTQIVEHAWEAWSLGLLDTLAYELRIAWRTLCKTPTFAATVMLTLGLGIGATTTILSVVDHVLLRPLDYADADRLVVLYQQGTRGNGRLVSYPTFQDWQRANTGLMEMSWIRGKLVTLRMPAGAERVPTAFVSPGFFHMMGRAALLGRTFVTEEERSGAARTVVLSYALWEQAFGGDPAAIGQALPFDSGSAVVIGIMPPDFAFPPWAQVWEPLGQIASSDRMLTQRDFHADSRAIGRLAAGVTIARATNLLSAAQQRIATVYPETEGDWTRARLVPLADEVIGNARPLLLMIAAAVALLFLTACFNVANLAAVRGTSRTREVAIRFALGGSRAQVGRQLAIESLIVTALGSGFGVAAAYRAVAWLRARAPFNLPRADELSLDGRIIAVALVLAIATAILSGLIPALRAATPGSPGALLGGRPGAGGTRKGRSMRTALTAAQFGIALVLLVGAGLFLQSYRRLVEVNLGFDPHGVFALDMILPQNRNATPPDRLALYRRFLESLRATPGVDGAAVVNFLPLGRRGVPTRIDVPGRPASSDDVATYLTISDQYFRTMRIPLLRGRAFSSVDMTAPGDGIVISESVAKRYWPGADPLGKPVTIFRSSQAEPDFGQAVPSVVIGVVGDVRQFGPESDPDPAVYVPLSSDPWGGTLVVHTSTVNGALLKELGKEVVQVEPDLLSPRPGATIAFTPVEQTFRAALVPRRYLLSLVAGFGACALFLAAIGVFGVTSYAVARRKQEIGIRMALGATASQVLRLTLRWGVFVAVVGCTGGTAAALFAVRFLRPLLFATSPMNLPVLVSIPLALILVGTVAVYLPARYAAQTDPAIALRAD